MPAVSKKMNCILCDSSLEPVFSSRKSIAIMSDCRVVERRTKIYRCSCCGHVQKAVSDDYLAHLQKLYASYAMFDLTKGEEQLQYSGEMVYTRTQQILNNIQSLLPQSIQSWLDVGTGSGVMLRTLSHNYPHLKLAGFDLDDHEKETITAIRGVAQFYSGSLDNVDCRFEGVSLIHVLEHVPEPHKMLQQLANIVSDNGMLVIQVPDLALNPFDLVVYDHISHFSVDSLKQLLLEWFDDVHLAPEQVYKEITFIAREPRQQRRNGQWQAVATPDFSELDELDDCVSRRDCATAIFSTGPSGLYAGACMGEYLQCYIDEDAAKIGKRYCNVPIIPPADAPKGMDVIIPLPKNQQKQIQQRLCNLRYVASVPTDD